MSKNLLIIDDDQTFLESMKTVLKHRAEITGVRSRQEFMSVFKPQKFDLVITDYKMNFWDGLEVISHLKLADPTLPVIIITAYADKEMAIKCANLQVHRILEKPIELNDFYRALELAFSAPKHKPTGGLSYGPLVLQESSFTVQFNQEKTQLTETEFNILKILIENVEKRVDRAEFQKLLWGATTVSPNVLDTHLLNLKKKVPLLKNRLKNVRGKGYFLPAYEN